ncbi:MAG: 2Fe-2S iron-sulfur cluster-binding protein, partial [Syntrophorhabdaceae bacterium]|nr:2Fe-2S iron-sulfur cluster-binding protein [Syntrophorhabdaceae bacterium]
MEKIRVKIDGIETYVERGTSILNAAKGAGVHIPHLCYSENLSVTAACRLCIVEVEGNRSLVASCSTPVFDGMIVRTSTERVITARRHIIELLLSDHPKDCMVCEKSGDCLLERYAYEYGLREVRFRGEQHNYPVRSSNPFYERDYNKCILCGRCVTVCHEVQFCEAVDFSGRGFNTKVATFFDRSMAESPCVFCGNCVS